jgi:predicted nucleic acid-binding protein
MALDYNQKEYPICDTDIWIKNCKHLINNGEDLVFKLYELIYIPDAVRQELGRKDREDYVEDFEHAVNVFKDKNKLEKIKVIRLTNEEIFNGEEKAAVLRAFAEHDIFFEESTNKFLGTKSGVGEKVCVIYASVLEVPVILSDDGHCKNFAKNLYPYLNIIDYYELLIKNGYSGAKLKLTKDFDNKPIKEIGAKLNTEPSIGYTLSNYRKRLKA